ncbi:polymeric immunoglobulin receptor-like isoform X1 [Clarias gariepinus]|uniref:polymeric immunoglobulin receptor-like isoform X1 n=2 Tax=Clarias gariepinus TaxID=13013 RepID=UPI00234CA3B9|nr:polymeric immunoglobulin receptor-like isoform X1 [Clarias gariepinus]
MEVLLLPLLILQVISGCACLWTVGKLTAKPGDSVTIPCHYNWRFRENVKYWCRGKMWYMCVRVRERPGRVGVMDNPDESVITLSLSELQIGDTGRYWCAIEIKGLMKSDIRTSLELQVTNDPDFWVTSAFLSAFEGGTVHMRCLYSDRLKKEEKKWCRGGDLHSCRSQQSTQISQHTSLQLRDDGNGSFSVTQRGLQTGDAGWYWCSAAGVQAPVHISIRKTHNYTHNNTVYSDSPSPSSTIAQTPQIHTLQTHIGPSSSRGLTTFLTPSSTSASPEDMFTSSALGYSSTLPKSPPITKPSALHRLRLCVVVLLAAVMSVVVGAVCWRFKTQQYEAWIWKKVVESEELNVRDNEELLDHNWSRAAVLQLQEETNS